MFCIKKPSNAVTKIKQDVVKINLSQEELKSCYQLPSTLAFITGHLTPLEISFLLLTTLFSIKSYSPLTINFRFLLMSEGWRSSMTSVFFTEPRNLHNLCWGEVSKKWRQFYYSIKLTELYLTLPNLSLNPRITKTNFVILCNDKSFGHATNADTHRSGQCHKDFMIKLIAISSIFLSMIYRKQQKMKIKCFVLVASFIFSLHSTKQILKSKSSSRRSELFAQNSVYALFEMCSIALRRISGNYSTISTL